MIFEYCDDNLLDFYQSFKNRNIRLNEEDIRRIIYGIASALNFMQRKGFFHRDLKPENILIDSSINTKLADFGLAREIRSSPPYTEYVSTRWYRAPEILLKSKSYNSPVDIFALGCIMVELYNQEPLFTGQSNIDQLNKIINVLGTPDITWDEGYRLARKIGLTFSKKKAMPFSAIVKGGSHEALDLIKKMLVFDSKKRISAPDILKHNYFSKITNGMK